MCLEDWETNVFQRTDGYKGLHIVLLKRLFWSRAEDFQDTQVKDVQDTQVKDVQDNQFIYYSCTWFFIQRGQSIP